jgi:hypothetical protein
LVAEAATEVLRLHLQDRAIQGFPRAIVYRANAELHTQTEDALLGTAQSCGVGAMRPNSVLLGWPSKYRGDEVKKGRHGFVRLLRDLSAMRKALIVVKDGASLAGREPFDATRTVDVWWVVQDGGLLLLLPWLLKRSKLFGRCRLRLFAVMTGLFAHHWNAGHGGSATIPSARPRVEINRWFRWSPRNFRTLELGHIDVDSSDFWTHRLLSSSSRSTAESLASKPSHTRTLKFG